jgi:hypothetical protein
MAVLTAGGTLAGDGKLDRLKKELENAALVELDIMLIIESDIFDMVDSTDGKVLIADDSRYCASLDDDIYWFDGRCISEYVAENGQVTRDCLGEAEYFESELIFIKSLDRYYKTTAIVDDSLYSLTRKDSQASSLPDSLTLIFRDKDSDNPVLEYYDLNKDLNIVDIRGRRIFDTIPDGVFDPDIPDSVEVIIMP